MSAAHSVNASCAAERAAHLTGRMVPTRRLMKTCGALSVTQVPMIFEIVSMLILHGVYQSSTVLARAVAQVHASDITGLTLRHLRALVALVELAASSAVRLVDGVRRSAAAGRTSIPTCLSRVQLSSVCCVSGSEVYQLGLVHRTRVSLLEARCPHAGLCNVRRSMQRQTIVLRLTQQLLLLIQWLRAADDGLFGRYWASHAHVAGSARVSHRILQGTACNGSVKRLRWTLSLALAA